MSIEPEPRDYATVEELETRLGKTLDTDAEYNRAQALLHDASTIIRAVARGDWDDPIPDVVTTVCLNMTVRAWQNPEGVRQVSLGQYSETFANADLGVAITSEERRLIRIAAGYGTALDSIQLTSGYGTVETVFVPVTGGGDWLPFRTTTQ